MKKTFFYRLFGLGSVPKRLLPLLEQEGIVVSDEGMRGCFIAKHVNGPKKRYRHRAESFSGCLVVTRKSVICYTYGKRQINISTDDPKIANLYIDLIKDDTLCLTFESSAFREGWMGLMTFRFNTKKAHQFYEALIEIGVQQGPAPVDDALRQ
ncbi:hypothetical protein Q4488_10050 [Amphritea sp. 1_MG-2023]|uniref:hypothetical protein n=1 Tax=Amphritea sp. 1_MG-2023 TaxID=3062670 RepID=UPI0026E455DA|nr:hypothetical protein [Amphritea sp. 1_MG-2023]MDO6563727.1 hypothetical protein [Amphritea sp. 1_MG-2023]